MPTDPRFLKWLPYVLGLVFGISLFALGRWTAPERVETRTETKVEWREKVIEKRVEVQGKTVDRVKVVWRTVDKPIEGGERTTEVEATGIHLETSRLLGEDRAIDRAGLQFVKTESRPVLPQWRVSVLAGASLREPLLPIAGPLVLGLEVDRRIVGPLWLGLWASTSGAAGVAISGVF